MLKKIYLLFMSGVFIFALAITPVKAVDDGVYLISRSTSYVNPLTNKTEDGGTNIELGNSMCSSIVENQLLVEKVNGRYYVTVGLGLASNVSNVRFKLMNTSGSFSSVSPTQTGTSSANGDTVKHYRIEMSSLSTYISPILYVTPMGRDVQFFITLNQGSLVSGTGVYNSLLISKTESTSQNNSSTQSGNSTESSTAKQESSSQSQDSSNSEVPVQEDSAIEHSKVEAVTKESLFKDVKGLTNYNNNKESTNNYILPIFICVFSLVIIGCVGGLVYVKKIKK